jgi:hypothetical protein
MAFNNTEIIQSDLLARNVSWFLEDLKLYDNQSSFLESVGFTVTRLVTLIMALIVHRAFYKLMKRHPDRAVNQIIYPHMVRYILLCTKACDFLFTFWVLWEVRGAQRASLTESIHGLVSLTH